jgi:hypothetical protein
MNALPYVRWDCLVQSSDTDVVVYGWIQRADGRRDFVVMSLTAPVGDKAGMVVFTTSSAKHSHDIGVRLGLTEAGAPHLECERVDEVFGGLVKESIAGVRDRG